MKRILFTGGSGFIGKNIIPLLTAEYKIYSPSHEKLNLLETDKVKSYILKNKIEYIVHLANVGGGRDQISIKNAAYKNLKMFFSLVNVLPYVRKIITIGSGAEYDKKRNLHYVTEKELGKYLPDEEYGFAKYIISNYINVLNNKKIICLRLFGVYGPYEKYLIKFISNTIVKNMFKLPIKINQNTYFDYMYVDDLSFVIKLMINNKNKYCDYNICTGKRISLYKIAQIVNKYSDFKSDISILLNKNNYEYTGSNNRILNEFPCLKFTSIEKGIQKLYKWYQENKTSINFKRVIEDKYIRLCSIKK